MLFALCAAARKRYPEALECLLAALTAPSMVSNAITVAAYKKWALVNLIHNGKLPGLPRWAPVAVSRAVKLEGGPYQVRSLYTWCRHPFGYLFAFSVEGSSNGVEMSHAVKLEGGPCQVPSQSSNCGCVGAFIRHACVFDVPHMLPTQADSRGLLLQDLAVAYGGKSATVMTETVAKHQAEFNQVRIHPCTWEKVQD